MNYTKLKRLFVVLVSVVAIFLTNEFNCYADSDKIYHGTTFKEYTSEQFSRANISKGYLKLENGKYIATVKGDANLFPSYILGQGQPTNCDNYTFIGKGTTASGKIYDVYKCNGHSATTVSKGNTENDTSGPLVNLPDEFNSSHIPSGNGYNYDNSLRKPIAKIANTIILILQICTVGGIIFTGIRYMYAGIDAKTQIKKTLPFLIIGIVIIFAGPVVIKFIVDVFNETAGI